MAVQADIATEYSMGRQGFQLVTDTAAKTGNWSSLVPIEPTVFSSITGTNISGTWLSKTIPTGQVLPGDITGFQINSGAVIAFLARTP
jgi:hypothetical protein